MVELAVLVGGLATHRLDEFAHVVSKFPATTWQSCTGLPFRSLSCFNEQGWELQRKLLQSFSLHRQLLV